MSGNVAAQHASSTVSVEPAAISLEVRRGETLFDAAWRQNLDWPTICFGQAQCTFCHVRIRAGEEHTEPVEDPEELVMIRRIARRLYGGDTARLRLACRMFVRGAVTVEQADFTGAQRS